MQPDAGAIGRGFDFLQPRTGVSNQLQRDAIGEQQNLGNILGSLLGDTAQTRQGEITQGFQAAGDLAAGGLSRRGIDPGLLGAQQGIQREQGLSLGDLNDQLSQQRISGETDIANSISKLLLGSSEQAGGLLASLLGAGGIGQISSSTGSSQLSSSGLPTSGTPNPPSLFDSPFSPFPGGNPFIPGPNRTPSGGPGGGGGGGGGGGQVSDNPFFDPSGPDPSTPEGYVPPSEGVLKDGGPVADPIRWRKNQDEINRRVAAQQNQPPGGPGAPPSPDPLIAQSATGTQSAITQGGQLA